LFVAAGFKHTYEMDYRWHTERKGLNVKECIYSHFQ
jgi:hypothetical protein